MKNKQRKLQKLRFWIETYSVSFSQINHKDIGVAIIYSQI